MAAQLKAAKIFDNASPEKMNSTLVAIKNLS
jgi:hypothetical protein